MQPLHILFYSGELIILGLLCAMVQLFWNTAAERHNWPMRVLWIAGSCNVLLAAAVLFWFNKAVMKL